MPWKETDPMKERVRFIQDWLRRSHSVAELCAMYGISHKRANAAGNRLARQGQSELTGLLGPASEA